MGATRALIRANRSGRSPTASGSSASPTFGDGEGSVLAHRNHDARTKRAYVLADNKLAMNAGWDEELLAEELKGLLEIDLDFDIGVTGFSIPENDSPMEGLSPEEPANPERPNCHQSRTGLLSPASAISGRLAPIGSFAAAPWNQRPILPSWQVSTPKWSSPTLPTTCRSQDMPADPGGS